MVNLTAVSRVCIDRDNATQYAPVPKEETMGDKSPKNKEKRKKKQKKEKGVAALTSTIGKK
jgi:hypothetical protein